MNSKITVLSTIKPPLRWEPNAREVVSRFLAKKASDQKLPPNAFTAGETSVLNEARRILGRCLPPAELAGRETGLVVGYVQSGKTLSFETVISLARDNGFGLVIVLAGTKNNLRDQSEGRLASDLGIDEGEDWEMYPNASTDEHLASISRTLDQWKKRKDRNNGVLITVLKHGGRIDALSALLAKAPLANVPTLVIDDESDQASLNTQAATIRKGRVPVKPRSTVHESICQLRDKLPHHSYLQYTATPQANLLLSRVDTLNASFAEVVTPGDEYCGGKAFFAENNGLVVEIPAADIPPAGSPVVDAPGTLLRAIRCFLLAAAHHSMTRPAGRRGNRSMMIHPAVAQKAHGDYWKVVNRAMTGLRTFIDARLQHRPDDVAELFAGEYASLKKTFPSIGPLRELLLALSEDVFPALSWVQINGTKDAVKNVEWRRKPYWILIGGMNLDRGYTVEGLCVTYMPRALGGSPAADTLQQRARFFGYKRAYLGLCRVFLPRTVRTAFEEYVKHEEAVRRSLEECRGQPLKEWRRALLLNDRLSPTRANVIGLKTKRVLVHRWLVPKALHAEPSATTANQLLVTEVLDRWRKTYREVQAREHLPHLAKAPSDAKFFDGVPLVSILEDLLLQFQVPSPEDAERHNALLLSLADLLHRDPQARVDVFTFNFAKPAFRTRDFRGGSQDILRGTVMNQYFSAPRDSTKDADYRTSDRISVQLRLFNLGLEKRDSAAADLTCVPWYAVHVPDEFKSTLIIQDE